MKGNKKIFLTQFKDSPFIEIFRLEDVDVEAIFDNYQRYDFYQLVWFTEVDGDNTYFLDFNEYKLQDDLVVLIFPGQIDKLDPQGKKGYLFMIHNDVFFRLNQRMNSDYLNGYFSDAFVLLDNKTKDTLNVLIQQIMGEYESENRLQLLEIYMEAFLFHVASLYESTGVAKGLDDSFISELMKLIDRNFIIQRETDFYAERLKVSNKRLNELCKRGTGKTVKQHIQEKLILEIKKEIRLKKKSLKEIAFDLGFSEAAYFTRFFKQHTGQTPTEFRDM